MIEYPKFATLVQVHESCLRGYSSKYGCHMGCIFNEYQSRSEFEALGGNTQGCMCKYGKLADEPLKPKDWVLPDIYLFEVDDD